MVTGALCSHSYAYYLTKYQMARLGMRQLHIQLYLSLSFAVGCSDMGMPPLLLSGRVSAASRPEMDGDAQLGQGHLLEGADGEVGAEIETAS